MKINNTRGAEMAFSTIIVVILLLIVFTVIAMFFLGQTDLIFPALENISESATNQLLAAVTPPA
ncbi:MAG: hypothetical protein ABIG20_02130 [archaeon]